MRGDGVNGRVMVLEWEQGGCCGDGTKEGIWQNPPALRACCFLLRAEHPIAQGSVLERAAPQHVLSCKVDRTQGR